MKNINPKGYLDKIKNWSREREEKNHKEKRIYWEKIKSKGKLRFLIVNGAITHGLILALVVPAAGELGRVMRMKDTAYDWSSVVFGMKFYLIAGPVMGMVFAYITWRQFEKHFGKE